MKTTALKPLDKRENPELNSIGVCVCARNEHGRDERFGGKNMTRETKPSGGGDGKRDHSEGKAMRRAITRRDPDEVRRLLDEGVDANVLTWPSRLRTALMEAAEDGCGDIMELLIDRGSTPELRDADDKSALDLVDYDDDEWGVADILLRHGAIRNPKLKTKQDELNEYYEARERLQAHYFDDRVYLYEVGRGLSGSVLDVEFKETYSVISRRNVHRYPPVRIAEFETYAEAIEFLRKVAPATPRVSLGHRPPDPVPSWEEYQKWVDQIEAAVRRRKEFARLLKWPKQRRYNKHGKRQRFGSSSPPCLQERALRAAIRRNVDKLRKGRRRISLEPLHSMVCLVPAKPRPIRSRSARTLDEDLRSINIFRKRIRPVRRDLYLENPRRTLSEERLKTASQSEARVAVAMAIKSWGKKRTK
ncbi:ankyrin repeat domain-containing protein [Sinorhizobium meliloti]|uniref:ankyrin repeat domain-containing protein n=1 Tax=Rhizobium meliloti TaxID=382 RepID=UPI00398D202E